MTNNKNYDCIFFIPSSGGGAEKVSVNIANILKRNGLDIRVAFIKGASTSVIKYLRSDIPRDILNTDHKISRYYGILQYIKKYRPKVVFASLTALSTVCIISKLFFKGMKVVTRQCFMPRDGSRIENTSIRHLFKFADINIAQTEEMKQSMLQTYGLQDNQISVIYNPLDIEDIENKIKGVQRIEKNEYKYIAIGRIHPVKGFDILIQAFAKVKSIHSEATLKIMGNVADEKYLYKLKYLVHSLSISDSVEIARYTENPYSELLSANCFVLSSITEGLPNVMLEAMYLNVPVAATSCIPFIEQAICEGKNGYVAQVNNINALSDAMLNASELYGSVENVNSNEKIEQQLLSIFKK